MIESPLLTYQKTPMQLIANHRTLSGYWTEDDVRIEVTRTRRSSTMSSLHDASTTLSFWTLVALIFYSVSGGPFGTEDAISAGGPIVALVGFIIFPFVWCIPEALITCELSSAFPTNSGYVSWANAAFGQYFGFQVGFLSWVSGVFDNAIYPRLFFLYLCQVFPVLNSPDHLGNHSLYILIIISIFTMINFMGLKIVGRMSILLMIIVLLPFVLLTICSIPLIDYNNLYKYDYNNFNLSKLVNVLFWNLNYWDSISTLMGEVKNGRYVLPRAMTVALFVVCLAYVIPLLIAILTMDSEHISITDWTAGYLEKVAINNGGYILGALVLLSSGVSNVGQFVGEINADAYQLSGMAENGYIPFFFSKRNNRGTPIVGICISLFLIMLITQLDFFDIVELLNIVYCLAELIEIMSFVYLRLYRPEIYRPYTVPYTQTNIGLFLFVAFPILFTIFVLLMPFYFQNIRVIVFLIGSVVVGTVLFVFNEILRKLKLLYFNDIPEHEYVGLPKEIK